MSLGGIEDFGSFPYGYHVGSDSELTGMATDDGVWTGAAEQVESTSSIYGDELDWSEAAMIGLHLVGGRERRDVRTADLRGRHSTYLGGQLRAGNDLDSLDGQS